MLYTACQLPQSAILLPCRNTIFEFYCEFIALCFQEVFIQQDEFTLLVITFFVVILLGIGVNQLEMNRILFSLHINLKGIIPEVFTGFDIVLVMVRPVKFYFFSLIGNSLDPFFIAAFADEISFIIIAAEKVIQSRINIAFQLGNSCAGGEQRLIFGIFFP